MNTLVVYDSFFGNTQQVAEVIGAALRAKGNVEILPASQITTDKTGRVDLLIVGSPTRGFRPTETVTKLLNGLHKDQLRNVRVAAFDTRMALELIENAALRFMVDKGGYAAKSIAKALEKKGGQLAAAPEGFIVTGEKGPLKVGELERAAAWAQALARNAS